MYSEEVAGRVRVALSGEKVIEKKMFGGIAFMVGGHMTVGVLEDRLMVRVGPDAYEKALSLKHARPMDFTGRPLTGMVYVDAEGIRTSRNLNAWVQRGLAFTKALPPKKPKKAAGQKKPFPARKKK